MDALREAMYELIETRDVSEIKVVDLIRKAGVGQLVGDGGGCIGYKLCQHGDQILQLPQ